LLGFGTDPKSEILNKLDSVAAFRDSLLACLAFAVFCGSHGSAEEGRDDNKYPAVEGGR
jgi:hypothetical protein